MDDDVAFDNARSDALGRSENSPAERAKATVNITAMCADRAEALVLLDVLGLADTPTLCGARAVLRADT